MNVPGESPRTDSYQIVNSLIFAKAAREVGIALEMMHPSHTRFGDQIASTFLFRNACPTWIGG